MKLVLLTLTILLVLVSIATTREQHDDVSYDEGSDEGSDGDWDDHEDMSGAGQLAISALSALVPVFALY